MKEQKNRQLNAHRFFFKRSIHALVFLFVFYSCGQRELEVPPLAGHEPVDCGFPTLAIMPSQINVDRSVSGNFIADILIMDDVMSTQVYGGAKAVINYNPNKLQLLQVINGDFADWTQPLFFVDDTTEGRIEILAAFVGGETGAVGSQAILVASLEFRALGAMNDTLTFERVNIDSCEVEATTCELLDPDDNMLDITSFFDGVVSAQDGAPDEE